MNTLIRKINQLLAVRVDDPDEYDRVRGVLLNSIINVFAVLGLIPVVVGSITALNHNEYGLIAFYWAIYGVAVLFAVFKSRMSLYMRSLVGAIAVYVYAAFMLVRFGLSGPGISLLLALCVLTAVLLGLRMGLAAMFLSLATIVVKGLLVRSGISIYESGLQISSTDPSHWMQAASLFLLLAAAVGLGPGLLVRHFARALNLLRARTDELALSEERLIHAQALAQVGSFEINVERGSVWVSDEASRIFGGNDDHEGFTLDAIRGSILEDDRRRVEDAINALIEGKTDVFDETFHIAAGDRGRRCLHGIAHRRRTGSPRTGYVSGTIQDITERRQMEDQLHHSQKMEAVGRLAGGVAHEFNNLLTGIKGNISLIQMDACKSDPSWECLNEIDKAANRAANLTRELLAYSRKEIIEPRVLSPNQTIEELMRMLERLIGENIDLRFRPDKEVGLVKVDAGQLEQIVINLVINARDAIEGDGIISIETRPMDLDEEFCRMYPALEPGEYALITVNDNGRGMDSHTRQRIFEPFFTTKPRESGTGLGLAVIYGIVRRYKGHIEVYSVPGEGSCFRVFLPQTAELANQVAQPLDVRPMPEGRETILMAEDDRLVGRASYKLLKRLGYTIIFADDPNLALERAREYGGSIDLLFTDVLMPGMNGRQLADEVLQVRPDIKVLYTSGHSEDIIAKSGILEEGMSFLNKPYTPHLLARKVRDVLDHSRLN